MEKLIFVIIFLLATDGVEKGIISWRHLWEDSSFTNKADLSATDGINSENK